MTQKELTDPCNRKLSGAMMYDKRLMIDTRTPSSTMTLCFARALASLGGGQNEENTRRVHGQLLSPQSQRFHGTQEPSKSESFEQGNVWHVPRQGGCEEVKNNGSCERRGLPWRFFMLPRTQQLPSCWTVTTFLWQKLNEIH